MLAEALHTELTPAERVVITVEKGGMRVKAISKGRSLLVLPIQFTHCTQAWRGEAPWVSCSSEVRLIRANLVQCGVLFQGDLDVFLSTRFGPFANVNRRLRDIEDMRKLGVVTRK